jgi:triosephosphate isomerase
MLLAGNWKMNGLKASLGEIRALARALADDPIPAEFLVCPPTTLIAEAAKAALGSVIAIGGQDCHPEPAGAFTGDISAEMLRDAGATAVIVGHSERRQYHGETNALVAAKAKAGQRAGLLVILCVGESEDERAKGDAVPAVTEQLAASLAGVAGRSLVIAYEPVWAIGTGRTCASVDITEMHGAVRVELERKFGGSAKTIRVLYGGSVKPGNAGEILSLNDVDGALIGGASLKAADFLAIARAAPRR